MAKLKINNSSERLFAEFCNKTYLKGFVFHSPKHGDNLQYEAGDVVLWVRSQLIVFEIVWRNNILANSDSTKSFVKRIGEKRRQLLNDYNFFKTIPNEIKLVNEINETVDFRDEHFVCDSFSGIILIDSDVKLERLSFLQYQKTLENEFPISIFSKSDFIFLTSEVDTIPDLLYYLKDRYEFLKAIFGQDYQKFLDLDSEIEKNLIAFYKMNEYKFPLEKWNELKEIKIWEIYISEYEDQIKQRDLENKDSYIIDELLNYLRNLNDLDHPTLLHSWELAILPRRARAQKFTTTIVDAIAKLQEGKELRYFAFYNQTTGCWSLFYFQSGGESSVFRNNTVKYSRLKLFYEMNHNNFRFSVFGYGFRKSNIDTGDTFDEVFLCLEDAENYPALETEALIEANRLFGNISYQPIREFPN